MPLACGAGSAETIEGRRLRPMMATALHRPDGAMKRMNIRTETNVWERTAISSTNTVQTERKDRDLPL